MKKYINPIAKILLLIILIGTGIFFTSEGTGRSLLPPVDTVTNATDKNSVSGAVLPEPEILIPAVESPPSAPVLHARYACVMDADSRRILYGKDETQKVPMASTTKIMTLILALESGRLEETVTASAYAASMPKVHLGMREGNRYRLKDLVYSLMLESHNDTAVAIAEHLAGSVEQFAELMNQKASRLQLTDTHFVTPNGLDADDHYSTASDMCRLAAYAIQNSDFLKIVQTKTYSFTTIDGKNKYSLTNKDAFLTYYDGALGIKTGFTGKAGYCFVGAARQNDNTLTSCVLACGWPPDKSFKWTDTKNLMDFGFTNYKKTVFPLQDLTKTVIPVKDGKRDHVSCKQPPSFTLPTTPSDSLKITYRLPEILCAPLREDTPIGEVSYYINDNLFHTEKIFLAESIEKSNFSDTIRNVFKLWMKAFGLHQ